MQTRAALLFNRNFKVRATAELLVEYKCQFIRVKQEQVSEKLEKTSIHIVETSVLSLWHRIIFGQGGSLLVTKIGPAGPFLVSQEWSGQTIFHPKSVRPDHFYLDHFFLWQYKGIYVEQLKYNILAIYHLCIQ